RCYRDWSSDVCSSDLVEHETAADPIEDARAERFLERRERGARRRLRARDALGAAPRAAGARGGGEHLELAQGEAQARGRMVIDEIGRASGRERVEHEG